MCCDMPYQWDLLDNRTGDKFQSLKKVLFCLHYTTEHTKQHLEAWARRSARPMKHIINSREKLHCYTTGHVNPKKPTIGKIGTV